MAEISIEPFNRAKHQRASFRCGKLPLDEFIRTLVTQYEKRRIGKTFVAVRTDDLATVVGFMPLLDDPKHLFQPISAIEAAVP